MHLFVAGAGGAVGRALLPRLLAAGHRVTGTSRSDAGAERVRAAGAEAVRVDALDAAALREAVVTAAPDAVFHMLTDLSAADGPANSRLRHEGTRNLVDAAGAAGVGRLVAQSISWAYAPGPDPAGESDPLDLDAPATRGATVAAVAALERISAELPQAVVLRLGLLYGPGTWYAPDGAASATLRGEPGARFLGSVTPDAAVSSFVHVDDAASAAVAALDWPAGPVNVVDDEPAAARDWVPALAAAVGAPAPEPVASDERPGWARGARNTLARSRGWHPGRPTWRTGFTED
ncbi:NAD-dependent epimerase/dehydratase family protein [Streptomyces avicenniae]|uniref:NAD-dependent epimerase/dehydratase family protein n=1 Tax=Streptomyces avicenniae TaxID=500153 RepID=UPI00069B933C|nr:NAD(P)-dependent oxidoreductase [Streptomyces avicenniae]